MEKLVDSYLHKGMRKQLVKEIQNKGIRDRFVIDAIAKIPRHYFFESIFHTHAYEDKAFPIGEGQTISQPYTVAFQTELLEVKRGDKILEIGTGSGYQACILVELGAEVYSIEYNKKLYERTKKFLPRMGYKPHLFEGDGTRGLEEYAPYDGILVTAGAPSVPKALIQQLAIGGKLVIPVGGHDVQKMVKITRKSESKVVKKSFSNFVFVPLLGKHGWKR